MTRLLLAPLLPAAVVAVVTLTSGRPSEAVPDDVAGGAALFADRCSSCHGVNGEGVSDRGPDIRDEGAAATDFVLRTGRMPMADPGMQARRGPVQFDDTEIEQLAAFVGALGDGPPVPDVQVERADVANGGAEFRLNCAACHVASGAGTAIGGSNRAPSLMDSSPTEVGESIVVGPGAMPVFGGLTSSDINDIAGYVRVLQRERSDGADALGGVGPVAEGLAAWLLGLLPIVAFTRWIGRSSERRDTGSHPDLDAGSAPAVAEAPEGAR